MGAFSEVEAHIGEVATPISISKHKFTISRLDLPEACYRISLPSKERAQGMPGARCTRGLVCNR